MDPTHTLQQSIVRGAYFEQMLLLPAALGEFRSNAKRMLGLVACFPRRPDQFFLGIPSFLLLEILERDPNLGFDLLYALNIFILDKTLCKAGKGNYIPVVYSFIDPSSQSSFIKTRLDPTQDAFQKNHPFP